MGQADSKHSLSPSGGLHAWRVSRHGAAAGGPPLSGRLSLFHHKRRHSWQMLSLLFVLRRSQTFTVSRHSPSAPGVSRFMFSSRSTLRFVRSRTAPRPTNPSPSFLHRDRAPAARSIPGNTCMASSRVDAGRALLHRPPAHSIFDHKRRHSWQMLSLLFVLRRSKTLKSRALVRVPPLCPDLSSSAAGSSRSR